MNTKKTAKSVLLACSLLLISTAYEDVYAQCQICLPTGTNLLCGIDAQYTFTSPSGEVFLSQSVGDAEFIVVQTTQNPSSSEHILANFSAVGYSPTLGTIIWTGDPARTITSSTVRSNQTNGDFPATSSIYMHINAELSSMPGRTFRSRTEVQVFTPRLRTWNPQVSEQYSLVSPVEFEDAATGETAFTLIELTCVLNPG